MYECITCEYNKEGLSQTLNNTEYHKLFKSIARNDEYHQRVQSIGIEIGGLGFRSTSRIDQIIGDFTQIPYNGMGSRSISTTVNNIFSDRQRGIQGKHMKWYITFCITLDIINGIKNPMIAKVDVNRILSTVVKVFNNEIDEKVLASELELLKRYVKRYTGGSSYLLLNDDRIRTIIISLYLTLEFDSYDYEGWKEEINNVKGNWYRIAEEINSNWRTIEQMRVGLEDNSGVLLSRHTADDILGSMKARLNIKVNNHRIAYKATLICYTGASFINKQDITQARETNAEEVSDAFIDFIETERTTFDLIMTNPYSNAAVEAARFGKLGNDNFKTHRFDEQMYENTTEPFENAYSRIVKQIRNSSQIKEKVQAHELNLFITDVSLPYTLFQVEYIDAYSFLNYIRLDLYSPFLESNSTRKSIIISKEKNEAEYGFFAREINAYKGVSTRIGEEEFNNGSGIHVFKPEENNQDTFYRRYYTGNKKFNRDDMEISDVELGISVYNEFTCDSPHYHLTTNEHYYIVAGEQKILDLETGIQSEAKEGDVVFIRRRTKHITKNKGGTKVVFAKNPLKVGRDDYDKVVLYGNSQLDTREWESSWGVDFKKGEDIS